MRRRFRFSIVGLLVLALIAAAIIAGYRSGQKQGQVAGEQEWAERLPSTEEYDLTKIVYDNEINNLKWPTPVPNKERRSSLFMGMIEQRIAPQDWSSMGGPYFMNYSAESDQLSVFASSEIHKEISDLLMQLSTDGTVLTEYATVQSEQFWEMDRKIRESRIKQLAPAAKYAESELGTPDQDLQLSGIYNVVTSVGFSPPVNKIEFVPAKPSDSSFGRFGDVKLLEGDGDQVKVTTDTFHLQSYGSISIGNAMYVIGVGGNQLAIVSQSQPTKILILDTATAPKSRRDGKM